MADLTIKQNDTWPPLKATLTDENGPIDLTTATAVRVIMKGTTVTIDGVCTVVSATTGEVSYTWAAGDTAVNGSYNTEFEINWGSGRIETVPNDSYKTVEIKDDLG